MATAYVSFGRSGAKGNNADAQIRNGNPTSTETVTTSASSAQSSNVALIDGMVSVDCDSALYATVGTSPTATPTTGWYIKAGQTFETGVRAGERIALVDV